MTDVSDSKVVVGLGGSSGGAEPFPEASPELALEESELVGDDGLGSLFGASSGGRSASSSSSAAARLASALTMSVACTSFLTAAGGAFGCARW
jgi:hypothetical protein